VGTWRQKNEILILKKEQKTNIKNDEKCTLFYKLLFYVQGTILIVSAPLESNQKRRVLLKLLQLFSGLKAAAAQKEYKSQPFITEGS
jgi:hypothetical protein